MRTKTSTDMVLDMKTKFVLKDWPLDILFIEESAPPHGVPVCHQLKVQNCLS